jgi:UDP:flavonoid glycosyltransferase YjiC (YdhE family)
MSGPAILLLVPEAAGLLSSGVPRGYCSLPKGKQLHSGFMPISKYDPLAIDWDAMAHIGVLVPGAVGHLNPASCLGRELQARDHRVSVFQVLDLEDLVRRSGLEYQPIGEEQFPLGAYNDYLTHLGTLKGLAALRYTIRFFAFRSRMLFANGPDLIRSLGVDLLLVDEVEPAGATIAEHLRLPYVTLSTPLRFTGKATFLRFSRIGDFRAAMRRSYEIRWAIDYSGY